MMKSQLFAATLTILTLVLSSFGDATASNHINSATYRVYAPLVGRHENVGVVKVIDGDTIDVQFANGVYRVRYIGVDTPEVGQCGYQQAKDLNAQFVLGKTVLMEKEVSNTDQFGRLLRHVYLPGYNVAVSDILIYEGWGFAKAYPPDTRYYNWMKMLMDDAAANRRGGWSLCVTQAQPTPTQPQPQPTPTPTPTPPTGSNCDAAYPDVCIPSPPPDLNCSDISFRRFRVLPPDPHYFDSDYDGVGCESGLMEAALAFEDGSRIEKDFR